MEKQFKRDVQSLESIFRFIEQFISSNGIEPSTVYPIELAVEELFTNILKYQPGGKSDVAVHLEKTDTKLIVRLQDFDAEPFDLTQSAEIDTDNYIKQQKPGGLGIHLVKRMVDDLDYKYNNRTSTITLIKNLEM
jgi:anti-sigma regulatory factor (Ser/Thr protein kinase)